MSEASAASGVAPGRRSAAHDRGARPRHRCVAPQRRCSSWRRPMERHPSSPRVLAPRTSRGRRLPDERSVGGDPRDPELGWAEHGLGPARPTLSAIGVSRSRPRRVDAQTEGGSPRDSLLSHDARGATGRTAILQGLSRSTWAARTSRPFLVVGDDASSSAREASSELDDPAPTGVAGAPPWRRSYPLGSRTSRSSERDRGGDGRPAL